MSVMNFPRVHFRGTISWDPGLANNFSELFDPARVVLRFPPGVTPDTFIRHVIDRIGDGDGQYGIWNYTGTHACRLEPGTVVTGGRLQAGGPLVTADPLVGRRIELVGKLVDLDPEAVWNSQIFFDTLRVGGDGVGLQADRVQRMHSRWINFRRSLDPLPIAGGAGVVWQTAMPLDRARFEGVDRSPLLAALQTAAAAAGGITVRFATYRTLYYQNGIRNQLPQRPRTPAELRALYQSGEVFSNPAYSEVVGTVGVWKPGEPVSWPGGRFLAPAARVQAGIAGAEPFPLGPAVAEVDAATRTLSLDFIHAVPELNGNLDKADLGPLTVSVQTGQDLFELARLTPADYARPAYEASAGIIDVPLSPGRWVLPALRTGQLLVSAAVNGRDTIVLAERELVALAEERSVYAEQGTPRTAGVRVLERGGPPARPVRLAVARYRGLRRIPDGAETVSVDAGGHGTVRLAVDDLGPLDYGLLPYREGDPAPAAPDELDITSGYFVSARTLPSDADLDHRADDTLTWPFVFETVLRTWHLINPVMSGPGVGLPLSDEATMTQLAARIREVTDPRAFETVAYMPVTRDLSEGKRRLLHRWCDRQARPTP